MPQWLTAILLIVCPATGMAAQPDHSPRAVTARQAPPAERLLPTPPAILRFGWSASDLEGLVATLRASTYTHIVSATEPGVLEFVCSPESVIPWGTPLFRVYDLDLLGDLTRAEAFAAQIGSRPFIVAPRTFPAPLSRAVRLAIQPPVLPLPVAPQVQPPATPPRVAAPIVRMPRSPAPTEEPGPIVQPAPAPRPKPAPDPTAMRQASERLAGAESRVGEMQALLTEAQEGLRAAQGAVAPLAEDVAARQRLVDAGVVARNDVKAAEERLREAEAAVSAAEARVSEARRALQSAEADRDAALAGVESAKTPVAAQEEQTPPPSTIARATPHPAPATAPAPRTRSTLPSPTLPPDSEDLPGFPSPIVGGSGPTVNAPPPDETLRLVGPGDLPEGADYGPLPWPAGSAEELARRRWTEHLAPWQCVVSQALAPQGAIVRPGTQVLELRATSVARLSAEVAEEFTGFCRVGAPVEVEFPTEGVVYRGWVSRVRPTRAPRPPGAEIEVLLVQAQSGDRLVYRDLEWMVLASPSGHQGRAPLAHQPAQATTPAPTDLAALFPLPTGPRTPEAPTPPDGELSGQLGLFCSERPTAFGPGDPVAQKKLERLREWHDSFIEGMKTTVFPESGLTLTYPREAETTLAIERMATRRVSHAPNMCARTVAEALGWGLGDAAMWATGLPGRGYEARKDGIARPGDIVVWPFTYGARRSQHVGIAVGQAGTVMLLSNQEGALGTQPLLGGYLAFHRAGDDAANGHR